MIPSVGVEDDTKNKGAEKLILFLLAMFGTLEVTSQEGTNGDVEVLKLADGYKERHLIIVGYGLSQICAIIFNELVEETLYSLGAQHSARVMIQKALNLVICVTFELHCGCFRFLSAIYVL